MAHRSRRIADRAIRYGKDHQALRAALEPVVAAGTVVCWRCRQPIRPGQPWDLGHHDDGKVHAGPEHRSCNRSAAAVKGNKMRGWPKVVTFGPRPGW